MAVKDSRRIKGTGSLFQRCEKRLGCPELVAGPPHPTTGKPTKVRPKHACKGMWVAIVELPGRGEDRRRKTIVRAKKADAVKALREARKDLDRVGDISGTTPTVKDWIDEWWLGYAPSNIKVTQRANYRNAFKLYVIPYFGRRRLDRIDVGTIEAWHRWLVTPKPDGAGLGARTAQGAHIVLSSLLQYAVRREKLDRNVARVAGAPKALKKATPQLTSADARTVMAAHDPGDGTVPQMLAMLGVAFLCGPRPSEILGMTKESFDPATDEITISWQLQALEALHGCGTEDAAGFPCGMKRAAFCPQKWVDIPEHDEVRHVEGMLYLVRPKTPSSWRRFPAPPLAAELLRTYLATTTPGIEGLLFHRPRGGKGKGAVDGRPISIEEWNRRWHAALAAAGINAADRPEWKGQVPTPHSARKTCNTILRDLQVPVDVRIKILGHAGAEVNEQIYTHTSDARVREAMAALGTAMRWAEQS